jgi:hypothetical protein
LHILSKLCILRISGQAITLEDGPVGQAITLEDGPTFGRRSHQPGAIVPQKKLPRICCILLVICVY